MKTRAELEAFFKNGKRPSQQEFADLIGSMLNRRDDQFSGRWNAGTTYRTGDVVIHAGALWEMHAENPVCSQDPPEDGSSWRMLLGEVISEQQSLIDDLRQQLDEQDQAHAALVSRVDTLESRADDRQQELEALQSRLESAEERLDALEQ